MILKTKHYDIRSQTYVTGGFSINAFEAPEVCALLIGVFTYWN